MGGMKQKIHTFFINKYLIFLMLKYYYCFLRGGRVKDYAMKIQFFLFFFNSLRIIFLQNDSLACGIIYKYGLSLCVGWSSHIYLLWWVSNPYNPKCASALRVVLTIRNYRLSFRSSPPQSAKDATKKIYHTHGVCFSRIYRNNWWAEVGLVEKNYLFNVRNIPRNCVWIGLSYSEIFEREWHASQRTCEAPTNDKRYL